MIDFLCVGDRYCGTSWLHSVLCRHPEIYLTDIKEHHFWDRRKISLEAYLTRFQGKGDRLAGDMTPAYAALPPATIDEVYRFHPAVRIFYVIRNPISKAWSGVFRMLQDAYPEKPVGRGPGWYYRVTKRQKIGGVMDYQARIQNWRAVFGEQFFVLLHDDLVECPHDSVARILAHIGVRQVDFFASHDLTRYVPSYAVKGNPRWRTKKMPRFLAEQLDNVEHEGTPPVPAFLVDHLRDLYRPMVESLSAYLKRDLSAWLSR